MKEVWIRKTIWRRYLVKDEDVDEVKAILEGGDDVASDLIEDHYDVNKDVEYDNEKLIMPIEFSIDR
jgi:hypothetical protein